MATIYYEPRSCNCDNKTTYTQSQINSACTQALSLASSGKTLGTDKYPHAYNDYEKFQFAQAQKPYLEFPILESGVYDGQSPGADRVVIGSIAGDWKSAVFCAVLTHDQSSDNEFTECANTGGKEDYSGRDLGEGRKLFECIDL